MRVHPVYDVFVVSANCSGLSVNDDLVQVSSVVCGYRKANELTIENESLVTACHLLLWPALNVIEFAPLRRLSFTGTDKRTLPPPVFG